MTSMRRQQIRNDSVDVSSLQPQGKWMAVAESVVGTQHEADGRSCEDGSSIARSIRNDGVEIVSICVCDGAGSARYGGEGARITSKIVGEYLVEYFDQFLEDSRIKTKALVDRVQSTLKLEAAALSTELRLFACTLVAVCCDSHGKWVALHLGDGGIFAKLNGEVKGISLPMKGEHANTTFFVTDKDAAEQIDCYSSLDLAVPCKATAFMLFSDGVENSLITHQTGEIAAAASSMMQWLEKFPEKEVSQGLRNQLQEVFRVRSSDNCTIGLMALLEKGPPNPETTLVESSESKQADSATKSSDNHPSPRLPLITKKLNRMADISRNQGYQSVVEDNLFTSILWNAVYLALGFLLGVVVCSRFPGVLKLIESVIGG